MQKVNTLSYIRKVINNIIKPGDFCIDATAGKGNDTAYLAEKVGAEGKVIAFDIQPLALAATEMLLKQKNIYQQVNLVLNGHEHIDKYALPETVDVIMFNLGYLPGGDHQVATKAETTLQGIEKGLKLLKPGGIMTLAIYHGGDTGFEERDAVLKYLQKLDYNEYTVMLTDFYNRPNYPPLAVVIQKEEKLN